MKIDNKNKKQKYTKENLKKLIILYMFSLFNIKNFFFKKNKSSKEVETENQQIKKENIKKN